MAIRLDAHLDEQHRDQQWHKPCRVATTANITIATALNAGDTLDGVTLAAGDRVLVKDQSSGAQNGIYVVSASPARAYDMLAGIQAMGAYVHVISGTANGGTLWRNTNTTLPTIDSTALTWEEVSGGGGSIDVQDGTTTVSPTTLLSFDPASFVVTDAGGDEAEVGLVAGAGGAGEIDYAQVTSNTTISATTEATATTIVTGASVSYNGTTSVIIEFFSPYVQPGNGANVVFVLYQDGSSIGLLGQATAQGTPYRYPTSLRRKMTPAAGSHTYSIRAYRDAANGTVAAGAGGTAALLPAFIRITDANATSGVPDLSTLTIETDIQPLADYVAAWDSSASAERGFPVGDLHSSPQGYTFDEECWLRVADTSSYGGGLDDNFSGTGASVTEGSDAGHPGIVVMNTGTTTTGRSRIGSVSQSGLTLGGGRYRLSCIAKITTLSDGTNTFTVRLGLGAAALGDSAEGVYFRYGSALNGGEWQGVCRTGGSEAGSVLDTNVAADTNFHLFEFEVNAAATSVEFFIDGSSVGTVSTNIPTGGFAGPNFMIVKSAGGTSRSLQLDWYRVIHELTTAR